MTTIPPMTSQYERIKARPCRNSTALKPSSIVFGRRKERMRLVLQRPFLVVRAAGSGIEGSGDLLALRGDVLLNQVKTTKSKRSSVVEPLNTMHWLIMNVVD